MTHTTHSLRLAGTAVAAALALASTPSLAQDTAAPIMAAPDPVLVVPDIPAPAAPEPIMVQQPTVQPVPEPPAEASALPPPREPVAAAPSRSRPPAQTVERATPPPRAAEPVAAIEPANVVEAAIAPVATAPAPVIEPRPVEPGRETANGVGETGLLALILGGLVFLALAVWGFVAIGRRKSVRRYVAENAEPVGAPVTVQPALAIPVPVAAEPVRPIEPVVAAEPARPVEQLFAAREPGGLSHAGAAVALPRELPQSFEEREALFNRMVDARPDRANPFTDRKARMKRARLIMQSIGRDFGDADPWIDLSQYPNNWPELAHKRSAAA